MCEGDHKTMAKAIKDRVSLIQKKREQRQLVREELEKRNQKQQQPLQAAEALRSPQQSQSPPQPPIARTEKEDPEMDQQQYQQANTSMTCMWTRHSVSLRDVIYLPCIQKSIQTPSLYPHFVTL